MLHIGENSSPGGFHMRPIFILTILAVAVGGIAVNAQQHDQHDKPAAGASKSADSGDFAVGSYAKTSPSVAAATEDKDDDTAIFCPTMKTGQLCSHGTASVLQLQGDNHEQWVAFAKKYNKSVNDATLELFKDAEGVLTPEQMTRLKAWFAVGLNPQINEMLYSKGLAPAQKKK
jgi:hypothetical protein